MTFIDFSTCDRKTALSRIQQVYPSRIINDDMIKDLLDLVEKDIVRVQDPMMYGGQIGVVPGNNWNETFCPEIIEACSVLKNK